MTDVKGAAAPKAAAEKSNKVLVVGRAKSGKKYILQKLLGAQDLVWTDSELVLERAGASSAAAGAGADAAAAAGAAAAAAAGGKSAVKYVRWHVTNKYYSALLDLHVLPHDVDLTAHGAALARDCNALVLVFDSTDRNSFEALRERWLAFIKAHRPAILMVIGNAGPLPAGGRSAAQAAAIDKLNAEAFDWGLDHGLEHIAVQSNNDNSKIKPHPAHFGPPEKYGTDRIGESLQAHIWPHMMRKPLEDRFSRGAGGGAIVKKGAGSGAGESLLAASQHTSKTADASAKGSGTTAESTGAAAGAAAGAVGAAAGTVVAGGAAAKPAAAGGAAAGAAPGATAGAKAGGAAAKPVGVPKTAAEAADLERDVASFESLFAQMRTVRDRNAADPNLTDADRRKAAEAAAVAMARALGLDDDDELAAMRREMDAIGAAMGRGRGVGVGAGAAAGGVVGGAGGGVRGAYGLGRGGDIDIEQFDDDDAADGGAMPGADDADDELVMALAASAADAAAKKPANSGAAGGAAGK